MIVFNDTLKYLNIDSMAKNNTLTSKSLCKYEFFFMLCYYYTVVVVSCAIRRQKTETSGRDQNKIYKIQNLNKKNKTLYQKIQKKIFLQIKTKKTTQKESYRNFSISY